MTNLPGTKQRTLVVLTLSHRYVLSDNKNTSLDTKKIFLALFKLKIMPFHHVISAAILKNANLGHFTRDIFGNSPPPVKYTST